MNKVNEKKQAEKEIGVKENLDENNNIKNNAIKGDLLAAKETFPIIMKDKKEESKNNIAEAKKKPAVAKIAGKDTKTARKPNV